MKDNISKRELHFEKEDAYKSLELVNGWINNLDTKASFLLAYLAVVLGFVVSNGRPNLFTQPVPSPMVFGFVVKVICVIALFLSLALSIVLFLSTLTSRIKGKEKQHLEKKQRLPIPERMELSALRKMKTIVEKIVSYLPDEWVRDALLLALEGRDLIEEKNRQRGRTRSIGHELR